MTRMPSIAERSLQLTGLFEAELLIEFMLREWKHPLAAQQEFRLQLLESAAEVLQAAVEGQWVLEGMEPSHVSLVTAICVAESTTLNSDEVILDEERAARRAWVEVVRRALPSCFCDPDLLNG